MKKTLLIAGLLTFSSSALAQMTSTYSPYELDVQEAHLNKQWKRMEEIASAHSRFVSVRQDLIINGYQKELKQWFSELTAWYDAWQTILSSMRGNALVDNQSREAVGKRLKEQMVQLDDLTARIVSINAKGQAAAVELDKLPAFPADYIDIIETSTTDTYAEPIKTYNEQLATAKARLSETRANFNSKITDGLKQISQALDGAIENKAAALGSSFPELKTALAQAKEALIQMRKADALVIRMKKRSTLIAADLADQKIYTAQKGLVDWKIEVQNAMTQLGREPGMTPRVLSYAQSLMQSEINVREGALQDSLRNSSALETFSAYYDYQLYATGGLVSQCLSDKKPKTLDCNRIRLVQGFTYDQILQLTDEQAAYMESLIEKARRGVYKVSP